MPVILDTTRENFYRPPLPDDPFIEWAATVEGDDSDGPVDWIEKSTNTDGV